jgi:hypothetical protein
LRNQSPSGFGHLDSNECKNRRRRALSQSGHSQKQIRTLRNQLTRIIYEMIAPILCEKISRCLYEVLVFCISLGADVVGLLLIVLICFVDRHQALLRNWQTRFSVT